MGKAAWGWATTTEDRSGALLDFYFAAPQLGRPAVADRAAAATPPQEDALREVRRRRVLYEVADLDQPPADCADAYLRLHLLSHRLVCPNSVNLDGIFAVLAAVCWTSAGPVAVADIGAVRQRAQARGVHLEVRAVDKFPRMLDYVVPSGVRVADASRVRLGAHLAEGTTVMHEGFVNFNAGTLGPAMIEGRISQGVTVGAGTDIGGGASILGTLSGGGKEVIAVGQRCLLGANSGLGISLGDDCIVEAGLYLTAGTLVTLPDGRRLKARELSGQPGWLFRRNSVTGAVECLSRPGAWTGLNPGLHEPRPAAGAHTSRPSPA
jgi:2,3,4,5-tetrahydropyridine-2,6-dicarboxylate N-succinyltransferase